MSHGINNNIGEQNKNQGAASSNNQLSKEKSSISPQQSNQEEPDKLPEESMNSNKPPEHLSEFYSFMNKKSNIPLSPTPSASSRNYIIPTKPEERKVERQPSLNTFTSFSPSVLDLPNIVTSKDFQSNIRTYTRLLKKAANLRASLQQVSEAANEFGQALEDCVNECPKANDNRRVSEGLINAGGLQFMIGSNQSILSKMIKENFEDPLNHELIKLQNAYDENHGYYQLEVKRKSKALREKELENLKLSKQKTRNLNAYKSNLLNLTSQLDEIDRLKYDYYHEISSMIEKFNLEQLLIKTGSIVRAQLEISEGIARKGWSGGGLDNLLEISPDLFEANYEIDNNSSLNEDHDDENNELDDRQLDKSASVATFKQNIDRSKAKSPLQASDVDINNPEHNYEEVEDDGTLETVKIGNSEQDGEEGPQKETFLSKITPSFGVKKTHEVESNQDESFSLPVVSNTSLLGSKNKLSEFETSSPEAPGLDGKNILDELDD